MPPPSAATVTVLLPGCPAMKVTLTERACSRVTTQLPVPLQAPPHMKVALPSAAALRVTWVPAS